MAGVPTHTSLWARIPHKGMASAICVAANITVILPVSKAVYQARYFAEMGQNSI